MRAASAPPVEPRAAPSGLARGLFVLAFLAMVALAALAFALATGSVGVDPMSIVRSLMGEDSSGPVAIVRELRLPRALCAFAVGGLLAVAGALLQVLLRNPLADPYVLGISGGAAVGALTALSAGVAVLAMPAAFTGAFASTLVVFGLARAGRIDAPWTAMRLLLTGVVVAAGWGAVIALLLTLAPDAQLRGMLFWLLGDLSAPPSPVAALAVLAAVVVIALGFARDLNVLSRGDDVATALGISVPRATLALHATAALATAVAVSVAGAVGFVGLVVPHALRLAIGNDQRVLLPGAALAGGALLVVADTLARSLAAPVQLPVGVITAFIGVPAFLYLLSRGEGRA